MAEQLAKAAQYEYKTNSNLVLQADRSLFKRVRDEPTGEPESLAGRIDMKKFGDRAVRAKPKVDKEKERSKLEKRQQAEARFAPAAARATMAAASAHDEFEGLNYRPKLRESRVAYEMLLSFVQSCLGDQPQDVLRGAADEVLSTLKDENLKDVDRKKIIEKLLNSLGSDRFSQLINLGKRITDYSTGEAEETAAVDDDMGVTVIFEDEENNEDDDNRYELNESDKEDDEGGVEADTNLVLAQEGSNAGEEGEGSKDVIPPSEVDAYWLQRKIATYYDDAVTSQQITKQVLEGLKQAKDDRDCENRLVLLLDYDKFDLVKLLTKNRLTILYCTLFLQAQTAEERQALDEEMRQNPALLPIIKALTKETQKAPEKKKIVVRIGDDSMEVDQASGSSSARGILPQQTLDLEAMAFHAGGHFMSNTKVSLPDGTWRKAHKGFEEVHVPALKKPSYAPGEVNKQIKDLPEWIRPAFGNAPELNRIQSKVYRAAFETEENILLCAPTGAGKTNVALLAMLHTIGQHRRNDGNIDLDAFKIVYVAPMKALVQEMVLNFTERLKPYNIQVAELTGDRMLTKLQIAETQVIVTTPEKWDIITRKASDRSYTSMVKLMIVDEIHLLHDDRGPVLECIIARAIRQMEENQLQTRILGLSATLPNYQDVATFLRVDPAKGLFFFDNSYRPCPLEQQYIGITEKKAVKRFQIANDITYDKIMDYAGKQQVIVFVHSRKETAKTARAIRDMAIEKDMIGRFLQEDSASREILQTESEDTGLKNADLKELLPYGFGVHHAGMRREDRTLVEDLFDGGHIKVLFSTATLAWGVNLPAHTVIIKGTQIYNPEKGRWVELSPQDIMQMMGRAGRPNYDTYGEGILITTHTELQYYLSLLNQQLPIESQFVHKLADNLNAEIVLGAVTNREEGARWLGYTYLYVRMLRAPTIYGVSLDELDADRTLQQRRVDLIHSAALVLDKAGLILYDRRTGNFQVTEQGRIASHYYITHSTMVTFNSHLKPSTSEIELLRIFSLADEFKYIPVREEEKLELQKLLERVPIPVKEGIEEPSAKVNVLLQSYISQLKLEGFALMADMVYITQSAGRLLRALFEICLKRGWARLAEKALDLCKMVDKRMWMSMLLLRQFKSIPMETIKQLEKRDLPVERLFDMDPVQLGEWSRYPKLGKKLHKLVHQFPKLDLEAHVQPVTRSMLSVHLTMSPDFQYDESIHGAGETFWILVEDVDGEIVLYHDVFLLKKNYAGESHVVNFYIPIFEPLPPNYFIKVVSDRWLHAETVLPVSFKHLLLPEKYPPHTELLDLQPLQISALRNPDYEKLYSSFPYFNAIQTQVFQTLYNTDTSALICARTGAGKTVCAEFAILRLWSQKPDARIVYIAPFDDLVQERLVEWRRKFAPFKKNIVSLTGEMTADLKLLEMGSIILSTPTRWDMISRRWKQRKNVQSVQLMIADEVHLIGSTNGPVYEIILSRMRYIAAQLSSSNFRIVALSTSLSNARDLGEWIGATPSTIFNFNPSVRPIPLEAGITGFNIPHHPSLMLAMAKPAYSLVAATERSKPTLVFVPSRSQARLTAFEIFAYAIADSKEENPETRFVNCDRKDLEPYLESVQDESLKQAIENGIAYYHESMSAAEKRVVETLFHSGAIQVVVASKETCWSMAMTAYQVILFGTQSYDGKEHRYVEYPLADILQMLGRGCRPQKDDRSKCFVFCQSNKRDFYKKFLFEALPVESHLDQFLHDHFNAEIVTKIIENKQDAVDYLTWTYLYRRMTQNPNYYNMTGTTHRHLSDHLSELVEQTLHDLEASKCIAIEDDVNVTALNLGMIAAYYYISYTTIELFALSLKEKTKLRGLLEIVAAASEYNDLVIRQHEDNLLAKLHERMPIKIAAAASKGQFNDPHVKANLLFQSHFSRTQLPSHLESDQKQMLPRAVQLVQACVDVISSHGWLAPALAAMEMSQMIVQAVWNTDSDLKQLPHFTESLIKKCAAKNIKTVGDLIDMDDDDRVALLAMNEKQLADVARACNRYPNVEVTFTLHNEGNAVSGDSTGAKIKLERDDDVEGPVVAPLYPGVKDEAWWVVVGEPSSNALLAIKRVTFKRSLEVNLEFLAPKVGEHDLKLYLMCDSYTGCDQWFDMKLHVAPGEEDGGAEDDDHDDGAAAPMEE